jgi:GTP cyclohydrolase IA
MLAARIAHRLSRCMLAVRDRAERQAMASSRHSCVADACVTLLVCDLQVMVARHAAWMQAERGMRTRSPLERGRSLASEVVAVNEANRSADALPVVVGLAGDALEIEEAEEQRWATGRPRHITAEQWERFEGYMREIFTALGMPAATPSTIDTPRRFLRALFDASSGYEGDEKLVTAFPTECHGGPDCRISQVVEGPIPFYSLCEHHSLPFYGHAYVGYIAHERILGLSKLTRLVRLFARRFSVQERIGQQLTESLDSVLAPHGVAVYLEAVHLCMQMRGVRERQSSTRTTYWRGTYDTDAQLRAEFFELCSQRG